MIGPKPGHRPSVMLPLSYLVVAVAAFILASLGVPWLAPALAGHYYQPRLVALTHVVTLGWITLTIMGASYQLIPIVLERPIWSERLARWQLSILAVGITGMVGHFYIGTWAGFLWAASLVGLGTVTHLANMSLSLRGLTARTFTARLTFLALGGLALTSTFGLLLGAGRVWRVLPGDFFSTLHAHFHLALLGWVAPMVIGVAARVYPMFLLARAPDGWPGAFQFWGLALGVPAVVLGLVGAPALVAPGAVAVAAAGAGHLLWIVRIVRDCRRPALDWGLRFALTGAAFLVPATVLGLAFAFGLLEGPRPALAYAVLVLGGWVSLTIAGMMLKIVPFLVWYRVYAPQAGRVQVPTLAQLSWPAGEALAYALLVGGVLALTAAVAAGDVPWIRSAGGVLALGATVFGITIARILLHLVAGARRRPVAAPLVASTR
jgi:hypothetical protein